MSSCPCGSQRTYALCCELAHTNHHNVTTPEQLMRSRYSAHALKLIDYVINTYHPSCNAEQEREAITESINSDWRYLDVINHESGTTENEGFVTFKAYFQQNNQEYCLGERSRFVRENNLWYYIDGEFLPEEPVLDPRLQQSITELKVGRNDPCICGSGKKFKKCCG